MEENKVIVQNRINTKSIKWDERKAIGGTDKDIPLWIADMDFEDEPEVIKAMKKRLEHPVLGYTFQTPSLREAICGWYERHHGLKFSVESILPCLNVLGSMQLIVNKYVKPGESIMMFTPVYPQFYGIIKTAGAVLKEYSLYGTEEIDWDKAEELISKSKAVLFCNPHNPLARVWRADECQKLADICKKHGILLLSDEVHGEMTMFGNVYTSMAAFDEIKDKCIVFTSSAKTFNLAGLGGAALIIRDENLYGQIHELLEKYYQCEITALSAEGIEAAYTYADEWLNQVKAYLEENVSLVLESVKNNMPKVKCTHQGTFLMWLDFRSLNRADIAQLVKTKAHILADDGERYGACGAGFIRMNIACGRDLLKEAVARLENLYRDIEENKI